MKKFLLLLFTMLILSLSVTSCRIKPDDKKITYTEEFSYLPKHNAMVLLDFQEGPKGEFSQANYVLEGSNYNNFLDEYLEILKEDGWDIVQDQRPQTLSVSKSDHVSAFILNDYENELTLTVVSK